MSEREALRAIIGRALGDANNGNLNKFVADQVIAAGYKRPVGVVEGVWTMTESEFNESIRAAKEVAWEEGTITGVMHFGQMQAPRNPHARG